MRRELIAKDALGHKYSDQISEWELGLSTPNIDNLFKLAHYFSVRPDELHEEYCRFLSTVV